MIISTTIEIQSKHYKEQRVDVRRTLRTAFLPLGEQRNPSSFLKYQRANVLTKPNRWFFITKTNKSNQVYHKQRTGVRDDLPSEHFLFAPKKDPDPTGGFFHPLQLLHRLSGSELQLQRESSSKRSESSKLNRSPSSHSSIAAATSFPPPSPPPGRLARPATFDKPNGCGFVHNLDPQPVPGLRVTRLCGHLTPCNLAALFSLVFNCKYHPWLWLHDHFYWTFTFTASDFLLFRAQRDCSTRVTASPINDNNKYGERIAVHWPPVSTIAY